MNPELSTPQECKYIQISHKEKESGIEMNDMNLEFNQNLISDSICDAGESRHTKLGRP